MVQKTTNMLWVGHGGDPKERIETRSSYVNDEKEPGGGIRQGGQLSRSNSAKKRSKHKQAILRFLSLELCLPSSQ